MLKIFLVNLLFCSILFSSIIKINNININDNTIQIGVFKDLNNAKKVANKYKINNDIYVEKINNYTVYMVNIKDKTILNEVKKSFKNAFFITKKYFPKNILIDNLIIKKQNKVKIINKNIEKSIKRKKEKIKVIKVDKIIIPQNKKSLKNTELEFNTYTDDEKEFEEAMKAIESMEQGNNKVK